MSEEAKVGLTSEATAIISSRQESREEKGSVNIWELDSDNIHVTEMLKETFLISPIATKCQIGIPSIHI